MTTTDDLLIEKLELLPYDFWDFKGIETKEYTHGIHSYPAMMVSPISRNIISIMKQYQEINSVFDPFSGSGTVLVEAMFAGINTIGGNDINPLALFLIKAKTTLLDTNLLNKEVKKLYKRVKEKVNQYKKEIENVEPWIINEKKLSVTEKKGYCSDAPKYLKEYCKEHNIEINIPDFKNIGYWFKPQVIIMLEIIKEEILKIKNKDIQNYIFVAFSETIRFVSNRRNGEFKLFRMTPEKVKTFNPDVMDIFTKILNKNVQKMQDFVKIMNTYTNKPNVTVHTNNACTLEDVKDKYDLVITSPPYGDSRTTVAYGEYSRLSLQWLNLDSLTEQEILRVDKKLMGGKKYKNGFESKLKSKTLETALSKIKEKDLERAGDVFSFYEELDKSIKAISEKTNSGGYQFWVVGNRTVKNELLQTDVIISELAKEYGLEYVYTINRNIPNKVMPSLNSPTNESGKKVTTMTMEHIVILRKL